MRVLTGQGRLLKTLAPLLLRAGLLLLPGLDCSPTSKKYAKIAPRLDGNTKIYVRPNLLLINRVIGFRRFVVRTDELLLSLTPSQSITS
jgi:hypothetical protein